MLSAGAGTPLTDYPKQFADLVKAMDPARAMLDVIAASFTGAKTASDAFSISLTANANTFKALIGAMGPAVTIQMQMQDKLNELDKAVENHTGNITAEQAALARYAITLAATVQAESTHNAALGVSATVSDLVKQKLDELQQKQNSLVGTGKELTDAQVTNAKRLIQAQTDGTFALQANIDATKVQTETIGASIGYADAYSLIQTKVNENLNAGKPLLDGVSASFVKLAVAAGAAKQAQAELKAQNDATFGLQTALLSSIDAQIASIQRGLHSNDWQSYMNDGLSAVLRITDQLKSAKQRPPATAANSNEKGVADEQRPRSAAA